MWWFWQYGGAVILAIDPGRNAGWVSFDERGVALDCGLSHPPNFDGIPPQARILIIERPHGGVGVASKRDIITLSRRMGTLIAVSRASSVLEWEPSTWKGSVPKEIMTARILERWMTPADHETLARVKRQTHDVIDAFGIGIQYLRTIGVRNY